MNSGWELNRKFFVRELFKLKSNIQGRFRQADTARDINKSKKRKPKKDEVRVRDKQKIFFQGVIYT